MSEIDQVLTRGVSDILPSKEGLEKLLKSKKITLYQGFDPSSPNLHLGNFIGVRKLAQFQKLGHKVIFLIGDFTGMIGDPTDKSAARKKLTRGQVLKNAKDYKNQISRILKFDGENAADIKYNSEWLAKLSFEKILELASKFSAQQMLERDFFQKRLKKQKPIYLHEFLYPLMQAYDCITMDVDLEIGGNDQLFNMLAGRTLMRQLKKKEKFVLTMKLLEDPTGAKMGKTEGNTINLTNSPTNLYRKMLKLPEELIVLGIELLTDLSLEESKKDLAKSRNNLAYEVVRQIHGKKKAELARKETINRYQKGTPTMGDVKRKISDINMFTTTSGTISGASGYPGPVKLRSMKTGSKSDAKRLIKQGAVEIIRGATQDSIPVKKDENPKDLNLKVGDFIKVGESVIEIIEDSKK